MGKYVVDGTISEICLNCVYINFHNNPRQWGMRLRLDNDILSMENHIDLHRHFYKNGSTKSVTIKFRNSQQNIEDLLNAYEYSHLGDKVIEVEILDGVYIT